MGRMGVTEAACGESVSEVNEATMSRYRVLLLLGLLAAIGAEAAPAREQTVRRTQHGGGFDVALAGLGGSDEARRASDPRMPAGAVMEPGAGERYSARRSGEPRFLPDPAEFVRVEGRHFVLNGAEWYPYGVNYYPAYALNPPNEFTGSRADYMFSEGVYDALAIEADLQDIAFLGMNAIGITLPRPAQCHGGTQCFERVSDLLDRCAGHGLYIFLYVPRANLTDENYDPLGFEAYMTDTTLRLSQRPQVFAYDVGWEPVLGEEAYRSRYITSFSRWIDITYSSIEAASADLGFHLRRSVCDDDPCPVNVLQAGVISHTMPIRVLPSEYVTARITMRNLGSVGWSEEADVRLGVQLPTPGRVFLAEGEIVAPGESHTFIYSFAAPPIGGRHRYRFQMVREGVTWFGGWLDVFVEVAESGPSIQRLITMPTPVLGPTDDQLYYDGPWRDMVRAFRRSTDTEVSREYAATVGRFREYAPNQLVSCRQGYGGNGSSSYVVVSKYPVDLLSTGAHFDFMGPEGYALNASPPDHDFVWRGMAVTSAYGRWASGERPVLWTEYGWNVTGTCGQADLERQQAHYDYVISSSLSVGADGSMAWWWPGGYRVDESTDYGVTNTDGTLRPACQVIRGYAAAATSPRVLPSEVAVHQFDLTGGVRGFTDIYEGALADAQTAMENGQRFVMEALGTGTDWVQNWPIPRIGSGGGATRDLWASFHHVELRIGAEGEWFDVWPEQRIAVSASTPIYVRAVITNLGSATWVANLVQFAANEGVGLRFRWPLPLDVAHLESINVPEMVLTDGLNADTACQFQLVADGLTWIDGALRFYFVSIADEPAIPTQSEVGLIAMTLGTLAAGAYVISRRTRMTMPR